MHFPNKDIEGQKPKPALLILQLYIIHKSTLLTYIVIQSLCSKNMLNFCLS